MRGMCTAHTQHIRSMHKLHTSLVRIACSLHLHGVCTACVQAQLLLQQTQTALAERAARESEATRRVQQAEKTLAAYKVRCCELRM